MASFLAILLGSAIGQLLSPWLEHQRKHFWHWKQTRGNGWLIQCSCGKEFGRLSGDAM